MSNFNNNFFKLKGLNAYEDMEKEEERQEKFTKFNEKVIDEFYTMLTDFLKDPKKCKNVSQLSEESLERIETAIGNAIYKEIESEESQDHFYDNVMPKINDNTKTKEL